MLVEKQEEELKKLLSDLKKLYSHKEDSNKGIDRNVQNWHLNKEDFQNYYNSLMNGERNLSNYVD